MRAALAPLLLLGSVATYADEPPAPAAEAPEPPRLDADGCVAVALGASGLVAEARGKVAEWAARLAEVESIFYPKLVGLGFVAPLYEMRTATFPSTIDRASVGADPDRNFASWGPYVRLQATLAQPIYTFGRAAAGRNAAAERLAVEQARLEQTRNVVALEVRKFYHLHLYAKSLRPALDSARRILDEAETKAKEMYASGSGKVTNVDLMKLRFGSTELDKYRIQAEMGAALAFSALKHTIGLADDAPLALADDALPPMPEAPVPPLGELVRRALLNRSEMAQIRHGDLAALSLEDAERLAVAPVVFAAAQIDLNWTAMWPDSPNPYLYDRFNDITPGVAVGLQFDVDIAKAKAKGDGARALRAQVAGLAKFAATGIPLEVRKARDDAVQADKLVKLSDEGAVAARKWMIFAGTAYVSGTGEAKDVLEGIAAYLQGKKGYYENLMAVHVARSTIRYATGEGARPAADSMSP